MQIPSGRVIPIRARYIPKFHEEACQDCNDEYNEADDTYYVREGWYECISNWDEWASVAVVEGEIIRWVPIEDVEKLRTLLTNARDLLNLGFSHEGDVYGALHNLATDVVSEIDAICGNGEN